MRTDSEQAAGEDDGAGVRAARLWRGVGPWVVGGAMGLVIVLIVAVVAMSVQMNAPPVWWQTVAADNPEVASDAKELENAIFTQLHLRRDTVQTETESGEVLRSAEWWVALPAEDANAWLAVRLPVWVAGKMFEAAEDAEPGEGADELGVWPEELAEVQVSFQHPHILVGARMEQEGKQRYFSATLVPELREDGTLWLVAKQVHVGRLSVPASWVLAEAEHRADDIVPEAFRGLPEAEAFFQIFAGERPFANEPEIRLGDGRRVRLLALRSNDKGKLEVKCRTEYKSGAAAADERANAADGAGEG